MPKVTHSVLGDIDLRLLLVHGHCLFSKNDGLNDQASDNVFDQLFVARNKKLILRDTVNGPRNSLLSRPELGVQIFFKEQQTSVSHTTPSCRGSA